MSKQKRITLMQKKEKQSQMFFNLIGKEKIALLYKNIMRQKKITILFVLI